MFSTEEYRPCGYLPVLGASLNITLSYGRRGYWKKICLLLLKITTLMPQKIKLQGLSGITGVLLTKITIAITILVEL